MLLWLLCVLLLAGCGRTTASPSITLATTTSTQDSGLLDALLPVFERETGIHVKVVAVGSGQALELGRRGDADVLLTHSPVAEEQFLADGDGEQRWPVMYNDFVLVGPANDPAKVAESSDIVAAFQAIATSQASFVSRGDESGTHVKERAIWKKAQIDPQGEWYISAGSGMAAVLRMTNEKRAYTLTDRGTFLALQKGLDLKILVENDPFLHNQYSVMLLNPQKHPQLHHDAARRFADFLRSQSGRDIIRNFGVKKYGQPLFFVSEDTSDSDER
jgi:tungstate transport system substrate-binding protein